MPSTDDLVLKAYKLASKPRKSSQDREKSNSSLKAALSAPGAVESDTVRLVHEYLMKKERLAEIGQPEPTPWDAICSLTEAGLTKSAAHVLAQVEDEFNALPAPKAAQTASGPKQIDDWIKSAKKDETDTTPDMRIEQVTAICNAEDPDSVPNALKEWFIDLNAVKEPARSTVLAISPQDPLKKAELLKRGISKGRDGQFLLAALKALDSPKLVLECIQESADIARAFASQAPQLLASGSGGDILQELWTAWMQDPAADKERPDSDQMASKLEAVAELLRTGEKSPASDRALSNAASSASTMLSNLPPKINAADIWAAFPLSMLSRKADSKQVDDNAAEHLAVAMEKLHGGSSPIPTLEACLMNLGLELIGPVDSESEYEPRMHDDQDGGLMPGDAVTITRNGWSLGNKVLIRAHVTKNPTKA